mmetsp:Transcript_17650/g.26143  ORF Transcript_17650/g.26143 Transcript_17650/m.26143 type:complete len:994 (-) Transcript_17650:301-3282(-)|eukprot:CAMPEP_0171469496 /NCGR_PEP_ID=MMETSP0945-20130129/11323_1 /TAXON_ID=109269 /ORGANISM="Vaucheria litorea, Strain CCMP2940" /LENGTH=993 /DNA_ID=CAMNT_0011998659 /DNA_START=89 /DNA_END=3070 /DNA_ORIENTATION=-
MNRVAYQIEVRVAEGRHIFKSNRGYGITRRSETHQDENVESNYEKSQELSLSSRPLKPPHPMSAGLIICMSLGNSHFVTEQCGNLHRPMWKKKSKFIYTSDDEFVNEFVTPTSMLKSLAEDSPSPLHAPVASLWENSPSRSMVEHNVDDASHRALFLRLFSDNVLSKEIVGEVVIDIQTLIDTRGRTIVTDRIGILHKENSFDSSHSKYSSSNSTIAIDTWVSLREGDSELRVQFLIQPLQFENPFDMSFGKKDENREVFLNPFIQNSDLSGSGESKTASQSSSEEAILRINSQCESEEDFSVVDVLNDRHKSTSNFSEQEIVTLNTRNRRHTYTPGEELSFSPKKIKAKGLSNWKRRPCPWKELDDHGTVTSTAPWISSLTRRLKKVEDQYSYSYLFAFSQTISPDAEGKYPEIIEIQNGSRFYQPSLKLEMLFSTLREATQRENWARCLVSSVELREAIKNPPSFRALLAPQRGAGGSAGVRVNVLNNIPLFDLVLGGIPNSLFGENCGLEEIGGLVCRKSLRSSLRRENSDAGFAFAGTGMNPLSGFKTSIPSVEIVRISGFMCTANYKINVQDPEGLNWTVFRRYSDFLDLYDVLPASFTSVMSPLPPKSWRSLSHITMTSEFLESRKIGLETSLRRLILQSTTMRTQNHFDSFDVFELIRSFLGMPTKPESLGAGRLWSVLPELELRLYPRNQRPKDKRILKHTVHTAEDMRLAMWLILSGAAKMARNGLKESQSCWIGNSDSEEKWVSEGGKLEDWLAASRHFEVIDNDVNRTYVNTDRERDSLRRVLRSFALHLPDVGYCQAMNFVAIFLLRAAHGREEITFWLLRAMAQNVAPRYWEGTTCMERLHVDLGVLRKLTKHRMPSMLAKLDSMGLPLELLACDWMLSFFCRVLPPLTTLRVWDWLLLEGTDVLIFVALAVLKFAEDDILQVNGTCASADKLSAIAASIHDADELIDLAVNERDAVLSSLGSLKKLRLFQKAENEAGKV